MNNSFDLISADCRGLFRTLLLWGVHFRTVRVYPRKSAANKIGPRKSAANKIRPRKSAAKIEVLASLLFFLCIIPINAQQHNYSIDQFVSMEIIQLDDQELMLYWCVPEVYLKQPDK